MSKANKIIGWMGRYFISMESNIVLEYLKPYKEPCKNIYLRQGSSV